ncbi:hypothetical protein D1007_11464 [Hordeum vulgare]|nr:hypothetical protein D1007_11464 [Hordeum vulgare]
MREGMLHIRDVEGPKKTGSVETRLEAMEQQVFKCQGMVEHGLNANHMLIKEFTSKHRIDANDIGKYLSRFYDMIDQLQAQIYDLQNQNCSKREEQNKSFNGETSHTAGTKSFARWAEDLRQEDPEKKQPHRAKVYLATHRTPRKAKDKNKLVRVQANGPSEENTVIKPRDTVMKETHPDLEHEDCNEFSYQEPSSLANHVFDVQIRKSKENMIENLTRLSKQSTQDKSLVHVSCKQKRGPSMKVGTQVILKSSTYPNKRHVAHATILSCKSKLLVGGVELGRQFIEVQVDQPIDECELLIERFSG